MSATLPITLLSAGEFRSAPQVGRVVDPTPAEFFTWITTPEIVADKTAAGAWCPSALPGGIVAGGSGPVSLLAFDVDAAGPGALDRSAAALAAYRGAVVPTFGASTGDPEKVEAHRVALEISRPLDPAAEFRAVWKHFERELASKGITIDPSCKNVNRLYFGTATTSLDAWLGARMLGGEPVDVDAILASTPAAPPKASPKPPPAPIASAPRSTASARVRAATAAADVYRAEAVDVLATAWPPPGARNDARMALLGALARADLSEGEAVAFLQSVHVKIGVAPNGEASIAHATFGRLASGAEVAGWPKLREHVDPSAVDQAEALLKRAKTEELRAAFPRGMGGDEAPAANDQAGDGLLFGADLAKPLPPLEYLVSEMGLVAGGGAPHLVAGYGFSGKTLALQSLLLSLAAGARVWGSYTGRKSRVVHVDLEQGARLTSRRYQRLALAMGVDLSSLGDALAVSVMPGLSLVEAHREGWRRLMTGRDVMLVDSLRAATGGQDENSSDIRAGLDMLGALSEETGCRVIVIHHARKPSRDDAAGPYAIRGSGAIFDAGDGVYIFSAAKGEPVKVEHVKGRTHGDLVGDFCLAVADVDSGGNPKAGLRVQAHGAELLKADRDARASFARNAQARVDADKVLAIVTAHPGLGVRELRLAAGGVNDARFQAALRVLGDRIEVRREKSGRAWKEAHFLRGAP